MTDVAAPSPNPQPDTAAPPTAADEVRMPRSDTASAPRLGGPAPHAIRAVDHLGSARWVPIT